MLYKYLPYYGNEFTADGVALMATPKLSLNDPFEFLPPGQWMDKFDEIWKKRFGKCASDGYKLKQFYKHIGVISFSETYDNLLMWTHYANEHKGIVIAFDENEVSFEKYKKKLKTVKYRKRIPYHLLKVDILNDESIIQLFEYKSDEWIYEKEHRIILDTTMRDYFIYTDKDGEPTDGSIMHCVHDGRHAAWSDHYLNFFALSYGAMSAIYFGCRMADGKKKEIIEKLKGKNKILNHNLEAYTMESNTEYLILEYKKYGG